MKAKGPILTLLAVVVLALILLTVNLTTGSEAPTPAGTAPAADAQAAPAAPPAAAEPAAPPAAAEPAQAIPAQAAYTGKTSGRKAGEASVAVTVKDGKASAYLCDGKKLESWLKGDAQGSSLKLTGKNGDELTGEYADGKLSGDVTVGGLKWSFAAAPSAKPAGLYRARNAKADAGWVVYPNGEQTGVQNIGGTATEAPRLDTAASTVQLGGDAVPLTAIQGGEADTVGR